MTRKLTVLAALTGLAISLAFIGCSTEAETEPDNRHTPYGDPPYSGSVSDTASDIHNEGPCTVAITLALQNGYITDVNFEGSSGNTQGVGSRVITSAPAQIKEKNSVEIDVLAGATITSNLVKQAGRKALAKIPGYTPD